jgi:hypothetical protein
MALTIGERLLAGQVSADYVRAVPTINLTDDELAAVTAAIRRAIEDDRFPHAPRLDPLRAVLGKFEAAPEPTPLPKAPPPAQTLLAQVEYRIRHRAGGAQDDAPQSDSRCRSAL